MKRTITKGDSPTEVPEDAQVAFMGFALTLWVCALISVGYVDSSFELTDHGRAFLFAGVLSGWLTSMMAFKIRLFGSINLSAIWVTKLTNDNTEKHKLTKKQLAVGLLFAMMLCGVLIAFAFSLISEAASTGPVI